MLTAIFQTPILGAAGSVQRRLPHGGGFVYLCVCVREREREIHGALRVPVGQLGD